MKELGHEPIFASNNQYLKSRAHKEGIKTVWFPWINRGPSLLRYVVFFGLIPFTYVWAFWLAKTHKPDLINAQSREDQIAFTLMRWAHKKPVVWKDPGDLRFQLEPEYDNSIKKFYRRTHIRAIKKADHIALLNSDDENNLYRLLGGKLDNTSCIPSSILYRYYDRNAKPDKNKPNSKVLIGTLARLEPNKGLQYLIRALQSHNSITGYELWLVNDGSYREELQLMSEGNKNIKFIPYTTDISKYLNTFDIFVHPVEEEGWGRVIKEAMYFGLPVIGSDVGGVKRQIEDGKTGLLIPVGDVDALAEKLKLLIENKDLRKKLGSAAKAKAETDGDFTKIVKEQILPIYERVVNEYSDRRKTAT